MYEDTATVHFLKNPSSLKVFSRLQPKRPQVVICECAVMTEVMPPLEHVGPTTTTEYLFL